MCGFAAMLSLEEDGPDRQVLEKMTATLVHRGPDDHGFHVSGPVGFGFRRLAILDLSPAAHQPMASEDGRFVLAFNGEIFNYVELRRELEGRGHGFRSTGDTEVLLRAWQEWGPECLPRLNGMWAFLIWDGERRRLFASRDRFGIKPLYVHHGSRAVLLASEIKAIRASGLYQGDVNWETAAQFFLRRRLDYDRQTLYEGIEAVPAGSVVELSPTGAARTSSYWDLDEIGAEPVADPAETFAELFEDAVRLRMRSDVPVGVCLSGGLDSTSIICAMARQRADEAEPLMAFSYIDPEYDESRYVRETIERTGARLNLLDIEPADLWEKLDRVLWYHDEPLHSMTPLVGYELFRLAAEAGVTVVLNGQGADEVLGGYSSYFRTYWYTLLRRGHVLRTWGEIRRHAEVHGGAPLGTMVDAVRHTVQTELRRFGPYRSLASRRHAARTEGHPWFTEDLTRHLEQEVRYKDPRLNNALRGSMTNFPLPLYLRIEDRNSMAHSVEARLPFMDYRLVTLAFHLAAEWKVRGPYNKYLLRRAMRGRIPESVRTREDKMGFPTPMDRWLAGPLHDLLAEAIENPDARGRGIYRVDRIRKDLERHRRGEADFSRDLFAVAQFEIWLRRTRTRRAA